MKKEDAEHRPRRSIRSAYTYIEFIVPGGIEFIAEIVKTVFVTLGLSTHIDH
jgi:hypothetical protein